MLHTLIPVSPWRTSITKLAILFAGLLFPDLEQREASADNPAEGDAKQIEFFDDFSDAIVDRYQFTDAVTWKKSRVQMATGSRLLREISTGPSAELTVDWEPGELKDDEGPLEFQFGTLCADGSGGLAVLVMSRREGKTVAEAIIAALSVDKNSNQQISIVRRFALPDEMSIKGRWRFRYHYGLVELFRGDQRVAIGDVARAGLPIGAVYLFVEGGKAELRWLRFSAMTPPPVENEERLRVQQAAIEKSIKVAPEVNKLLQKNRADEAIKKAQDLLNLMEQSVGKDADITIDTIGLLAMCLEFSGKFDAALKRYQQVYQSQRQRLGETHPQTARTLRSIASCLSGLKRLPEARVSMEQALRLFQEVLGEAHLDTAFTLLSSGRLCHEQNHFGLAQRYFELALHSYELTFGPDSDELLLPLRGLTYLYEEAADIGAARKLLARAIEISTKANGALSAQTIQLGDRLQQLSADESTEIPASVETAGSVIRTPANTLNERENHKPADDEPAAAALQPDDFRNDPQQSYVITGDIDWQARHLAVNRGGRISSVGRFGPTVKLLVGISDATFEPEEGWEARFIIVVARSPLQIVLDYPAQGRNKPAVVRVISKYPDAEGRLRPTLIRTFQAPTSPVGTWSIAYNQGLVEIQHEGRDVGVAWSIPLAEQPVNGFALAQSRGQSRYTAWDKPAPGTAADIGERPELTSEVLQALMRANEVSGELCKPGTLQRSLAVATEGYELSRRHLGETSGRTLAFLGKMAFAKEQMGRAVETLADRKKIVESTRKLYGKRHPEYGFAQSYLASALILANRSTEAVAEIESALLLLRPCLGEDNGDVLNAELQLGLCLADTSRHAEAAAKFASCAEGFKRLYGEKNLWLCMPLEAMANNDFSNGKNQEAVNHYRQSLAIREAVQRGTHPEALECRRRLATAIDALGDYRSARELLEHSIRILQQSVPAPTIELAEMQIALAQLFSNHGDHDFAQRLIEPALMELQKRPVGDTSNSYVRCGNAALALGTSLSGNRDWDRAIAAFKISEEAFGAGFGADHPTAMIAQFMAAIGELNRGHAADAVAALQDVLAHQRRVLGDENGNIVSTLQALARSEDELSHLPEARDYLLQAYELSARTKGFDNVATATIERELSATLARLKDETTARRFLDHSLKTFNLAYGERHPKLAEAYEYAAGVLISLSDWRAAESYRRRALEMYMSLCEIDLPWLPEAQALRYVARLQEARDNYLSLCATVHGSAPGTLTKQLKTIPEIAVADVYELAFQSRAIAMRSITRPAPSANDPRQQELLGLRAQIARLMFNPPRDMPPVVGRERLDQLTQSKEALQRELALETQVVAPTASSFPATVDMLPPGTALVDIVFVQSPKGIRANQPRTAEYEGFIVRKIESVPGWELNWVHLGPAEPIDQQITSLRAVSGRRGLKQQELPNAETARWRNSSQQLGDKVWARLAPYIRGCGTVLIVPEGSLSFVPWYALPGAKADTFLIEDVTIGTITHARQVVEVLNRAPVEGNRLITVGGIDFGQPSADNGSSWDGLPGTQEEVAAIGKLWQVSGPVTALSGIAATKAALQAELDKSRYIHIATHGAFAETQYRSFLRTSDFDSAARSASPINDAAIDPLLRNPLALCGIVLSGANQARSATGPIPTSDCLLTGEEIVAYDMGNAEMVVLSACETGLGALAGGEGVFSLQRAFHLAGTRTVVGSLWQVDDRATRTLMVEFYRNLWERKLSRIESLRQAQLTVLHRYDDRTGQLRAKGSSAGTESLAPYYWAAFVLSGDWR